MKTLKHLSILITFYFVFAAATETVAQTSSVFTTGLQAPTKIVAAGQSSLLVAETGIAMPNTSRISIVDRETGARRTLIAGLPSGFNSIEQAPSGASGLKLNKLKLYLATGQGDSVVPGSRGGFAPNPNPATPLNNSILEFALPADYETLTSGFTLSFADQATLAGGAPVTLQNAEGKILSVRLVSNLPDYKVENRPGLPQGNVRPANLFGIELLNGDLYVVDASFNQLYKVNSLSGEYETFMVFPPVPNPLPFGPPVSEAVPTSVHVVGHQLFVSFLTGFPFAPGNAEVWRIDWRFGDHSVAMDELTSAMDVLPVPLAQSRHNFYVLEFSTNMLSQPMPPGRLTLFTPEEDPVISTSLISPTSLARDADTGDLFITEIFTGRIIRIIAAPIPTERAGDGDKN